MYKNLIALTVFIFSFSQISFSQSTSNSNIYNQVQELQSEFSDKPEQLFMLNRSLAEPSDANNYVTKAEYFQIDELYVEEIKEKRPNTLYLEIPFEGKNYKVQLYKKDVTTSSYRVKTSSGAPTKKSKSVFYRGIIKNDLNSIVSLSVLTENVRMTLADEKGNFEINRIKEDLYAAYRVADSKHTQVTECGSDDIQLPQNVVTENETTQRSSGDCIEVYIECDFDSFLKNGSNVANTEDWALGIMNEVAILYENEGVPMVVSDLLIYDFSDPYTAENSTGGMLDLMGSVIGNNYEGRLAHLFSTRSVGGGIAWVNVLCSTNNGGNFGPYAVSGAMSSNVVPFPIFSWNVMVVAHELGHNVGSSHTHSCVWNGNGTQIDDCGNEWLNNNGGNPGSCYDSNNPILPNSGTIMSYCHLIGGVGINFNEGFGSQVGALLFNKYTGANCVTGDECASGGGGDNGPPPVADFTVTQFDACAPSQVQFTNQSFNDPVSFEWFFPGGNPDFSTEEDPFVIYNDPGFYDVTLIATNSNGTDEFTLSQVIDVQEAPTPDFDFEYVGLFIDFINQTGTSVNSYFWDFGDGNFSSVENPLHGYANDGTYTVILTVDSDCGIFEVQKVVEFYLPPTAGYNLDFSSGCSPFIVSYSNSSSSNTDNLLWTFEGGTPSSSTEENPIVVYDQPGTYDVSLVASNDNGEDELLEVNLISVEASPTADFSFNVDALEVSFTDLSSDYTTIAWDFGDGNNSNIQNPNHSYAVGGIYNVTLIVNSDDCGIAEITQQVNVTGAPIASIDFDTNEGCEGHQVNYSAANSNSADSYLWQFEGGIPASSTEQNVIVEYPVAGVYNVSLTVTNTVGDDTQTIDDAVAIFGTPSSDFNLTQDGLNIELEATSVVNLGTMYTWELGDGNMATGLNTSHTYLEEGIYTVILYTSSLCGESETSQIVNSYSAPIADFNIDQEEGCAEFTVQMTDASSENVTEWSWTFPGGNPSSSTEQNPVVSYSSAGTYDVQLIVNNPAGSDEIELADILVVNDLPSASFTSLSDMNTVSFTNTSLNGDSYDWEFGDGNTSILENPVHTYDLEGSYEATLRVTNECGTVESSQTINLSSIPLAGYSANITEGCIPLTVEFSDNSSSNVTAWEWSFPGGNPSSSTEESPTIVYDMTGLYNVSLVVTSSGGNDTLEIADYIATADLPSASFQFTSSSLFEYSFTNTSFDASEYVWDFGDGNMSSLENPNHTFDAPGLYVVTLRATNACGTAIWQEEIEISESTSVSGIDYLREVSIYPNPNQGKFLLSIDAKQSGEATIEIYNVLGQKLNEDNLNLISGKNQKAIQLNNSTPGAYFMLLRSGEQSQVLRLLVN